MSKAKAFPFSGEKLRRYRTRAEHTQASLADAVGCHEQEISSYERGERAPRLERWRKIAAALSRQVKDFLESDMN